MERFLRHLTTLLRAAITNEEHSITQLSYMPADEAAAELERSRGTTREYPTPQLIHALIAEQAARTPQAAAIREQATTFTYDQLEQSTNRLAHHLQASASARTSPSACASRTRRSWPSPASPCLKPAEPACHSIRGIPPRAAPKCSARPRRPRAHDHRAAPSMPAADCLCLDTANPPGHKQRRPRRRAP